MPSTRPGMTASFNVSDSEETAIAPPPNSTAALFQRHGDMQIPPRKALADTPAFGHIWGRSSIPGGRCSQGGVKIPTGGKGDVAQARERLLSSREEGSADSVRFRSRRLQSG